ncbi:MAG TPA: DUF1048 domain-containing protein [Candidatus Dormibacteraeota bacterium]|jgi:DNA-binding ferritin-like protein (Dps family)|nr:DUF1048 domain-containing protein [Candidatus Dormibacteraeota bacterium]
MAAGWVEQITGSLEQKKRYRQYKARTEQLPASYHSAIDALVQYMQVFGPGDGESLLRMLEDLVGLFEQSAVNGTSIRAVVGENPAEFAETFLRKYPESQWIRKQRDQLNRAIDRVAGEER